MFNKNLQEKVYNWLLHINNSSMLLNDEHKQYFLHPTTSILQPSYYTSDSINEKFNNNNINNNHHPIDTSTSDHLYQTANNYNDLTNTSKMFQLNATKYFESKNISISDLNITSDNINDFLDKLLQLSKPINLNDTSQTNNEHTELCNYNCNSGYVRDMLVGYKGIHGYVSLVVSLFIYLCNINIILGYAK